ncbi:venom carboxylesterase-6-like [Ochlerotatus camptorhynchus]|uniref:venom carboxylesterase-6-like n=1 Tax=Ochlerotatus camptorhynchus TaxID=644619 RepID=UPI0031D64B27
MPTIPIVTVLIIALFVAATVVVADQEFVVVQTENGPLRGVKRDHYYAFEGIPYARAPLGELRWVPSEVNDEQWHEPRNATSSGPFCIQWNHFVEGNDKTIGEEDCLFLNVYTTSLDNSEPLPTIFHIHGGAFMFGSGIAFQERHLMKNQIISVTINYRVGPFGFLSTEDDVIPGNYGLKDQVTALKWVRLNIAGFGGHPDSITLSGYSAGSASVQLHYLSLMSRGLFKNAIGHSGSALNPWVLVENSAEKANKIAVAVGCPIESSKAILDCLKRKPAREIVKAVDPLFDFLYNPFSPLGVVIEKQSKNNPTPFLTDHPYTLIERGHFYKVPLILSLTEAEGLYSGAEFMSKPEYVKEINSNWNQLLPSILDYRTSMGDDDARRDQISQMIKKRYLGEGIFCEHNFRDFIMIMSNRLYFAGVIRSAQLMQAYIPVYIYYDMYKTKYGVGELLSKSTKNYGVAHGEDIFLIYTTSRREAIPYTEEETLMAGRFVDMYEQFSRESVAKFGDHEIPRMNRKDMVHFLEINYPTSEVKLSRQLSDEEFWNQIDFNDGMPVVDRPVSNEP